MDFSNKVTVITGGGSGIGRELALQLFNAGCHVALGDVSNEGLIETQSLCRAASRSNARVTTHLVDVSEESQVLRFSQEVVAQHETASINLLFNNAGIGGGSSMFSHSRELWEKTFNICWGGVYLCTRTFLPLLVAAPEAHLVNVSSVNGFWATIGPNHPHTSYSAAKFAVKGFTEALINDLRIHAPHVGCSVVMPGHIGTSLVSNSRKIQNDTESMLLTSHELAAARQQLAAAGADATRLSDDDIQQAQKERAAHFQNDAPTTPREAARIILKGVAARKWRILVGADAHELDKRIREAPDKAYEFDFFNEFAKDVDWQLTPYPQTPIKKN